MLAGLALVVVAAAAAATQRPGRQARHAVGRRWASAHGNASLLCFVHVPKNGGTVIRKTTEVTTSGWRARWVPRRVHGVPKAVGCSPWHTPDAALAAHGVAAPCRVDGAAVRRAAVIRHPYERAVSQYYWHAETAWKRLLGYGAGKAELNRFLRDATANASRGVGVLPSGGRVPCERCKVYAHVRGGAYHQDCHWLNQAEYTDFHDAARPPGDPWRERPLVFCLGAARDPVADLANFSEGRAPPPSPPGDVRTLGALLDAGDCDGSCARWALLDDDTLRALDAHFARDFEAFAFQRAETARDLLVHTARAPGGERRRSLSLPGGRPRGCVFPLDGGKFVIGS